MNMEKLADQAVSDWLEREGLRQQYANDPDFHAAIAVIRKVLAAVVAASGPPFILAPASAVYAQCLGALDVLKPHTSVGMAGLLREWERQHPSPLNHWDPWQREPQ
jgi:hypothetical protein